MEYDRKEAFAIVRAVTVLSLFVGKEVYGDHGSQSA